MEILTSRQMRNIDRRAVRTFGVPELVLMENAGFQMFGFLARTYEDLPLRRILLLCGRGNNGGDALVLARHLHGHGIPFRSILFGRPRDLRRSTAVQLEILRRVGRAPSEVTSRGQWKAERRHLRSCDLVIDGILGTGLSRPVEGLLAEVFADVNACGADVVAVDIPSGLSGDTAAVPGPCLAADYTVTFARPKLPHILPPAEALCGELRVVDVSIPPEAVEAERCSLRLIGESELVPLLPVRRGDSHKGDHGHALVVAGSRGKGGAARMVALGALRAGFVRGAMEAMTEPLPETPDGTLAAASLRRILSLLPGKRVVAIGPGLTTHPETKKLVRAVVKRARVPVVLDADGLNAFVGETRALSGRRRPLILTPHPGEMGRLIGVPTAEVVRDRVTAARTFARRHACWLVLKGHRTVIAAPDGMVHVNPTGNPGMAKGGSGDLLTGFLAGFLAQGVEAGAAVRLGVYLHGLTGDLAAADLGETPILARDLLARFPRALARLRPAGDLTERSR